MDIFKTDSITLYNGDCNEVIKTIKDGSVGLCVTDPPYLIGGITKGAGKSIKGFDKSIESLIGINDGYDIESLSVDIQRVMGGGYKRLFLVQQTADF